MLEQDQQDAVILAAAAFLVGQFSLRLITHGAGVIAERNGDYLDTNVVEETALSELSRRIVDRAHGK